jgi:hypothetical protein
VIRLLIAQRLIGLVMTLAVGAGAWFLFGKDIYDDVRDEIDREQGAGPVSERIYRRQQFGPALKALRKDAGRDAQLLEVSMRADRLEFHVRRGRGFVVLVGDDGDYDNLDRDEGATTSVPSRDSYSVRRVDPGGPQRIVRKIERREGGGDFLVTELRLARDRGDVVWIVHGRIGQRGIGYYADPHGRRVETATRYLSSG